MAEVTFDYQNLVEVEGGLRSAELDEARPRLREVAEELLESSPGFMRLPQAVEYAEVSTRVAEEIRGSGATDFIHVGIGGSALGPMALQKALNHPYYNALPREARRGPRIHFAENTDPATLAAILDVADPTGTWVNVVTKSGSTAETMANFLVIRSFLIDALGSFGYQGRTVTTTDPEEGFLKEIADREDLTVLPIPKNVGGRFSVLTPVGLLPAAVVGLDVEALLAGAAQCVDEVNEQRAEHPAVVRRRPREARGLVRAALGRVLGQGRQGLDAPRRRRHHRPALPGPALHGGPAGQSYRDRRDPRPLPRPCHTRGLRGPRGRWLPRRSHHG
jgi:glucose-6-phosphate isomerase